MLKATPKGRATTLSKTLLTAGLLGAAALTTLGAGSAKAEKGRFDCSFGTSTTHDPCNKANSWELGDKTLSNLDFALADGASGDFSFVWLLQGMYGTDVAFDPSLPPPFTGSYTYNLDVTPAGIAAGYSFRDVELDVDHFGTGVEVTKTVRKSTDPSVLLNTLVSLNGVPVGPVDILPGGQTHITVTDSWVINSPETGGITSISNTFTQVPAPLPLLGVGAVFGSIRKLRKFSSQLKTFSMG